MKEQLDIFDFIESPYDTSVRLVEEARVALDNWAEANERNIKLIHYSDLVKGWRISIHPDNLEYVKNYKLDVIETAGTFTYHFANMAKDIYIASFKADDGYYRVFQVRDRILVQDFCVKEITYDVFFPAMTFKMFDIKGNPIHFSNRDDFIMNDLGFNKIGVIRDKLFKKRDFATLKATWWDLVKYLGENIS